MEAKLGVELSATVKVKVNDDMADFVWIYTNKFQHQEASRG